MNDKGRPMNTKSIIAALGMVIFMTGLPLTLISYHRLGLDHTEKNDLARSRDGGRSLESAGGCTHALKNIHIEDRVLKLGQSANLQIIFSNPNADTCSVSISIYASSFTINPSSPQTISVPPGIYRHPWNIIPNTLGPQEIVFESELETIEKGFVVEDPGFYTKQFMQLLATVLAFLGPMATLPWWLERQRRIRTEASNGDADE